MELGRIKQNGIRYYQIEWNQILSDRMELDRIRQNGIRQNKVEWNQVE